MTAPKALKSLTFTALPKREANPVQERRTKTIARLEEQKQLFRRSQLHSKGPNIGKERGRCANHCRKAATRFALVDSTH